jgi:hypothetical protein
MAAATINDYLQLANPSKEVAVITLLASGSTYTSKKFSTVQAAFVTQIGAMAATDAYSISSISGRTVTVRAVGTTTPKLTLTLYGKH